MEEVKDPRATAAAEKEFPLPFPKHQERPLSEIARGEICKGGEMNYCERHPDCSEAFGHVCDPAPKAQDADDAALALAHFKKVNPHLANDPYFDTPEKSLTMQAYIAGRESMREELEGFRKEAADNARQWNECEAQLQTANKALEAKDAAFRQMVEVDEHRVVGVSKTGAVKLCNHWLNIARRALGKE